MLKQLIAFSLKQSPLVMVVAVLVLVFSAWQVPRMPVDVFPELNAPTVVILTEAGGLSANEVEQNVTFPIETSVNGLPGVRRVRSGSAVSLSIVYVEFDWGSDIYRARQLVTERLAIARERLPAETHTEIAPVTGLTGEIMLLSLRSEEGGLSPVELRSLAEFDLSNRLLAVPGVASVVAIGGELPEYQINVRQDRLLLYGLTTQQVVDAAKNAHSTASAGYLSNVEGVELPISQSARVRSVEDIKKTIVTNHNGAGITIGDVAEVVLAGAPRRGTAADGGRPAVVLGISKSPGTNTLQITADIDKALDQVQASLPKGVTINRATMRQADFIRISVNNVVKVLIEACIFVAIILVLFLLNVRTTVITLTALPLSLGVALLVLWQLGLSINVMTLGGLAVAIGELVDDAIIDVENVFRRLQENAVLPIAEQRNFAAVIFDASNEIRSAVVFATVIICLVFVPLLFLQGLEGRFFRPLGIAYITSIFASLLVALTVTPAMCKLMLRGMMKKTGEAKTHREGFLVRWLKAAYEPSLRLALRFRWAVIGAAAVLTVMSLLVASRFGSEFLPRFNEGTITVFLTAPPGTSLEESDRLAKGIDEQLATIEGVMSVVRRTGRAERDAHAEPPSRSEIDVKLKPGVKREDVTPKIDAITRGIPGISVELGQPIEHRLSHVLSGTPAALAINIYGEDLDTLRKLAGEVEAAVKSVPGTRDVVGNREAMIIALPVRYRHDDLRRFGLSPAEAAEQVKIAFNGEHVAEINEGVRRFDLVVRLHPDERRSIDDVKNLILRSDTGTFVRLYEVADIGRENTAMAIQRENAQRKAVVSCNINVGANLGDVVEKVQRVVTPIVTKAGYSVTYGGQFEAQQSAARTIYLMGAGVCVVILLLLYMALGSVRAALLVMVNLPLALVGGIAAIFLTESPSVWSNLLGLFTGNFVAPVISIASMVGFVTLFGIATRNGILLVDHYGKLRTNGKSLEETIIQGSMERLVPILMTALTAMLGLVPLAMKSGEPGSELLSPLAIVVLGGLVTSTFLNLIVVPAGYRLIMPANVSSTRVDDDLESSSDQPSKESL
jgi:CzcA family heavy metal efflux pump